MSNILSIFIIIILIINIIFNKINTDFNRIKPYQKIYIKIINNNLITVIN